MRAAGEHAKEVAFMKRKEDEKKLEKWRNQYPHEYAEYLREVKKHEET